MHTSPSYFMNTCQHLDERISPWEKNRIDIELMTQENIKNS